MLYIYSLQFTVEMFCLCVTDKNKGTIYPAFIEIHFRRFCVICNLKKH